MQTITNNIILSGIKIGDFKINHIVKEEKFYKFILEVRRSSGVSDFLPIIVSEKLLNDEIKESDFINVEGKIRTYNKKSGGVEVYVFATEINKNEEESHINEVTLIGTMCIKRNFRTTSTGRKIQDFILAVNSRFNKSDYIPVLAWGSNANFVSNKKISDMLKIVGRLQSRNYTKKDQNDNFIYKVAYEVSSSQVNSYNKENKEESVVNE